MVFKNKYSLIKFGLLVGIIFSSIIDTWTQPWSYDFGTEAGSHTSGESTTFLPSTQDMGGTARVRVGTGGGSFHLENPSAASGFGSGSSLRIVAPTSGSVNKFSIYRHTPANISEIKCSVLFGNNTGLANVNSGTFYFFSGSGASFSDNNNFTSAQIDVGLRFMMGTGDTVIISRRTATGWSVASFTGGNIIQQGMVYNFEIYSNNSNKAGTYTFNDVEHTLPSNRMDVWINGVKILNGVVTGALTSGADIDALMFYGESSVDNAANLFVDDIEYGYTTEFILPIDLLTFNTTLQTDKSVLVYWTYANAIDFERFGVEHSTDGRSWTEIGSIDLPAFLLRSNELSYTHRNPMSGHNYYRLRMIDLDGTFSLSDVQQVFIESEQLIHLVNTTVHTNVLIQRGNNDEDTHLMIYDLSGKSVHRSNLPSGESTIHLDVSGLTPGMYILHATSLQRKEAHKIMKVQ